MQVGLDKIIEALARMTKMKRAPAGVRSTGLMVGAFVPTIGGMRVEMPGGSYFVWVRERVLTEEIEFDVKPILSTLKVLRSLVGTETTVHITHDRTMLPFEVERQISLFPVSDPTMPTNRPEMNCLRFSQ